MRRKFLWVAGLVIALALGLGQSGHAEESVVRHMDWGSIITVAGAASADTISTTHGLGTGRCHESNPLFGPHPSATTLWVSTAMAVGMLVMLNYVAHRMQAKGWQWVSCGMNWGMAGLEGIVTVHNVRTCW